MTPVLPEIIRSIGFTAEIMPAQDKRPARFVLPRMDSLISASAKREQKFKVRYFFKGSDFSNGHVPGTYMSHYIENNGLKPKLLKHLDDPFYYFLVYNEAAKKDKSKPFVFSKQSIAYLTSLRKLYLKSK